MDNNSLSDAFSIALIVASAGRFASLEYRLPIWANAEFDEVILVGKYRGKEKENLKNLCKTYKVKYVPEPETWKDTRSYARNLGATTAKSKWIVFGDDDDDIIGGIDRTQLENAAVGKDWLVGLKGDIIVYHKRESFLRFGGYPEDMVSAEDMVMSSKARRFGKGGFEGNIYRKIVPAPPIKTRSEYNLTRAKNNFWYGATYFILLFRTPTLKEVIISESRRTLNLAIRFIRGDLKCGIFFIFKIFGYLASFIHLMNVYRKRGKVGLTRESTPDWQGLR